MTLCVTDRGSCSEGVSLEQGQRLACSRVRRCPGSLDRGEVKRTPLGPSSERDVSFRITCDAGQSVIHVEGPFEVEGASKLRALLMSQRTSNSTRAVIDFTRARDITDIALAAVVEMVRDERLRVRPRGLSARHSRMLRFLSGDSNEAESQSGAAAAGTSRVQQVNDSEAREDRRRRPDEYLASLSGEE